jgi:hypothetical protein
MELVVTEEFWYDLENKQITISGRLHPAQLLHTVYKHRVNLIKKFPGWKVVIDDVQERKPEDYPPSWKKLNTEIAEYQEPSNQKSKVTFSDLEAFDDLDLDVKFPQYYWDGFEASGAYDPKLAKKNWENIKDLYFTKTDGWLPKDYHSKMFAKELDDRYFEKLKAIEDDF